MKKLVFSCLVMAFTFVNFLNAQTSLAEGIKLYNNENYTGAQNFFEAIIKKEPTNGLAHYYVGQVKYALEDYKGAKESYDAGLKANSKCNECNVGLAKLMLDNGKEMEATKILDPIEKSAKKNASLMAMVGDVYLFSKKPNAAKAIEVLTKSRDLDPKVASTWAHMGDAYKLKGDMGNAMTNYESAVSKDPSNLEAYMSMAKIWASSRQVELAIEKLESALKLSPDYAPAYKDLYELYFRTRQYQKGLPILKKYVSLAGTDLKARIRLVKFLCYTAKDYESSISEANLILNEPSFKLDQTDVMTLNRFMAWSYAELGKYQESFDASEKMFKIAEQDTSRKLYPSDYNYKALAALKIGNIEVAEKTYEQVFKEDKSNAEEVYGNFVTYYKEKKDNDNVIKYLNKKNEIKPLSVTDQYYLALAYYGLKKYGESDGIFSKILETTPSYGTAWLYRAKIAQSLDGLDPAKATSFSAKPYYEKVLEFVGNEKNETTRARWSKEALSYLAYTMVQLNDNVKAKSYYEQLLAIDPTNTSAQDALKILSGN